MLSRGSEWQRWEPHIHAPGTVVKSFQALSYERLRVMFREAFSLSVREGALMNMFVRSHPRFKIEAEGIVRRIP